MMFLDPSVDSDRGRYATMIGLCWPALSVLLRCVALVVSWPCWAPAGASGVLSCCGEHYFSKATRAGLVTIVQSFADMDCCFIVSFS